MNFWEFNDLFRNGLELMKVHMWLKVCKLLQMSACIKNDCQLQDTVMGWIIASLLTSLLLNVHH